jgi:outer membrane receptor for ferrienterochelin and colicins
MKQFKLVLCILTLALPFTSFAQAQEVKELGKIVVTATMTEKEIEKAPGSIEVITSQEIKDINAQTIAETLEIATGLIVSDESGRVKGLSIRGTGNKRALILIDGRRFSLGYKDSVDLKQIPIDMIERIEVIRGPTSALYGSDAIGGVVNIITKKPPKELAMGATFQYGMDTYGEGEEPIVRGYLGDTLGRFGFLFAGSYLDKNEWDRDGIIPDDGDDEDLGSITGRLSFELTEHQKLLAGFEYSELDREGLRFYEGLDRERIAEDTRQSYFLQYNARPNPLFNFELRAYHSGHEDDVKFSPFAETTPEEDAERELDQVEGRFTGVLFDKHIFTAGSEFRKEEIDIDTGSEDIDNFSIYLQDEYQIFDPLYLVLGVRFDDHSESGSEWNPRSSLIYKILDNLRFKASYGTGFRAPGLSELYVTSMRQRGKKVYESNPDLDAETSESYEVAIEGEYKKSWGRITAFRNEIEDLIEPIWYKSTGKGKNKKDYYRYQNVSEATTQGVELECGLNLPLGFSFSGNMAYLDTENEDTDKDLEGEPKYKGHLQLGYRYPEFGLRANVRMDYIGERYYAEGTEGGYSLFHCFLSKEISQYMELFAGVNNIFDKREEKDEVVYVEPTYFYGGLSIKF